MYCHCVYMSTVKGQRLQIRIEPREKVLLERAAEAAHLNVSAFVLQSAALRAEELLAERQSIRLTPEASAAFTQALESPAKVNERLTEALHRPRKFSWLD
jgi:uncharacterized protein (DUF1778 family)